MNDRTKKYSDVLSHFISFSSVPISNPNKIWFIELTMYIGEPQSVAAMTPSCRNLANPKSAIFSLIS